MIINDLYTIRPFRRPQETDSILLIDTNTKLPSSIRRQSLQSISWRHFQIVKHFSRIEKIQLTARHSPSVSRTNASRITPVSTVEYGLSDGVREGAARAPSQNREGKFDRHQDFSETFRDIFDICARSIDSPQTV